MVVKRKKFLAIGVVLHSIQDYYAHSYISDLQDFKGKKLSEKMKSSRAELIYHTDWLVYDVYLKNKKGKEGKAVRDKIHSKFKDNPYYDVYKIWARCFLV